MNQLVSVNTAAVTARLKKLGKNPSGDDIFKLIEDLTVWRDDIGSLESELFQLMNWMEYKTLGRKEFVRIYGSECIVRTKPNPLRDWMKIPEISSRHARGRKTCQERAFPPPLAAPSPARKEVHAERRNPRGG